MPAQKVPNGLDLQGKAIDGLLDPVTPQQGATKNYVDTRVGAGVTAAAGDGLVESPAGMLKVNVDTTLQIIADKLGVSPDFSPCTVELMGRATAALAPAPASAASNTELFVASKCTRTLLNLTLCTQVRLCAQVAAVGSVATASIKLSYMKPEAATWAGSDTGATIVLGTGAVGVLRDSGWQTLAVAARVADVTVAGLVGSAFGATPPTISALYVMFR